MNFLEALFHYPTLQMAVFAAIGASFASGVIGSYVVVKRIVSLSGSIAHAVLSGLGAALYFRSQYDLFWLQPIYGALVAAIVSACIIGIVHIFYKQREDAVIAMIWSIGMAIGVIFISQVPGYNIELMHYLLGNILWTTSSDLWILVGLNLIIFGVVFFYHHKFIQILFDDKQATLKKLPVTSLYLLLLILIALSIVILIHVVGIILVLSMLALPPSIANCFTKKISIMMLIAICLNILLSIGGLALAYKLDWPVGATIALFSGVIYLISLRFRKLTRASTP